MPPRSKSNPRDDKVVAHLRDARDNLVFRGDREDTDIYEPFIALLWDIEQIYVKVRPPS